MYTNKKKLSKYAVNTKHLYTIRWLMTYMILCIQNQPQYDYNKMAYDLHDSLHSKSTSRYL